MKKTFCFLLTDAVATWLNGEILDKWEGICKQVAVAVNLERLKKTTESQSQN
jgi:hypothetical protein